ncbi:DNA repair protein xrcc3 [Dimargaris xerosporica]|nr:DNA repair protein xrcc3 [Dimargaris xerosporica]
MTTAPPAPLSWTTAQELLAQQRFLTTGDSMLDDLLGGGVPVPGVVEVSGASASGKTQLCLQLCLTVQLPQELGGLGGGALYFSTEDSFPSRRLAALVPAFCARLGLPVDSINVDAWTDNVLLAHLADSETQDHLLTYQLPALLTTHNVRLVVIDSITANFRGEQLSHLADHHQRAAAAHHGSTSSETQYYIRRQRDLLCLAQHLKRCSEAHGVAVVCVNQVSDNFDAPTMAALPEHHRVPMPIPRTLATKPALGLSWSQCIHTRITLHRYDPLVDATDNEFAATRAQTRTSQRIVQLVFAPHAPPGVLQFTIDQAGVQCTPAPA